jgi:hypothetical protein
MFEQSYNSVDFLAFLLIVGGRATFIVAFYILIEDKNTRIF